MSLYTSTVLLLACAALAGASGAPSPASMMAPAPAPSGALAPAHLLATLAPASSANKPSHAETAELPHSHLKLHAKDILASDHARLVMGTAKKRRAQVTASQTWPRSPASAQRCPWCRYAFYTAAAILMCKLAGGWHEQLKVCGCLRIKTGHSMVDRHTLCSSHAVTHAHAHLLCKSTRTHVLSFQYAHAVS